MTNKEFVLSVYPRAEIQFTATGRHRVVTEPTLNGRFLGTSFPMTGLTEDEQWRFAAIAVYERLQYKLEN